MINSGGQAAVAADDSVAEDDCGPVCVQEFEGRADRAAGVVFLITDLRE
jgi:hypothetical protein